jgi:hypothetical protein
MMMNKFSSSSGLIFLCCSASSELCTIEGVNEEIKMSLFIPPDYCHVDLNVMYQSMHIYINNIITNFITIGVRRRRLLKIVDVVCSTCHDDASSEGAHGWPS